jgi:hypothetical protein
LCRAFGEKGARHEQERRCWMSNRRLLAIAAIVAFFSGSWWNSRANRKAKEPLAPAVSIADYCAIFLWIMAVVLGAAAFLSATQSVRC